MGWEYGMNFSYVSLGMMYLLGVRRGSCSVFSSIEFRITALFWRDLFIAFSLRSWGSFYSRLFIAFVLELEGV